MGTISIAGLTLTAPDDKIIEMFAALTEKMSAGEAVRAYTDDSDGQATRAFFIPPSVVEVSLERPFTDDERHALGITPLHGNVSFEE